LADVKVVVAAEHASVVEWYQVLFKVTDDEHSPAQVQ
jgi:hypothetical protein